MHSVNPVFFMWNTFLPGGELISDQVFHTWVERLKSTLIPNDSYLTAAWALSLFPFVCYSLNNLRCVNLIRLYQKQSLDTKKTTMCIFFVLVNKGLCLTFLLANMVAVNVCVCARVCHVDGTPVTSKLQPDVNAEGLATQGSTVGGTHTVQSHYSHIIIIHA